MTLLAVALAAASAWLWQRPSSRPRLASLLGGLPAPRTVGPGVSRSAVAWAAAGAAALGCLVVAPVPMSLVAALGCLVLVPRLAAHLEPPTSRRRREALARQGPVVADLLAATLASGAPMRSAVAAVSEAVTEPSAGLLRDVVAAVDLGAEPGQAWSVLASTETLREIAAAASRSARTGAPLSAVLARLADDMRRERRVAVEVAARAAGVRAVLPLAVCFLPAFLLLGVVPVVAALATQLLD